MSDADPKGGAGLPPNPDAGASTPRSRRRIGRWLALGALSFVVLMVVAGLAAAWWAVRSERGSAWLLGVLPGVQVEGPRGALFDDFDAARVTIEWPGAGPAPLSKVLPGVRPAPRNRIVLTDFGWRGLGLQRGAGALWAHLTIDALYAKRIDVSLAPTPPAPSAALQAPADLRLPIEIELRSLKIAELHATPLGDQHDSPFGDQHDSPFGSVPLRALDAALHLGAEAGARHRIEHLAVTWDRLALDAKARIDAAAPMALEADLALSQSVDVASSPSAAGALPAWAAHARLVGPLAEPVLTASLRADGITPSSSPQTLDLQAALRPFAPWPLGALTATAKALDLSAFTSALPPTALVLDAHATSTAADQPASVVVDLRNDTPGRWSDAALPLQSLHAELAARPDRPGDIELRALALELGTPRSPAGRVDATGAWSRDRWMLDARLAALLPARLDARAPAMELAGRVEAKSVAGSGTSTAGPGASPAGSGASTASRRASSAGASPAGASASAAASGPATATVAPAPAGSAAVNLVAALDGRLLDGTVPRPVTLRLDARLGPRRLDLRDLQAIAGAARASASGTAVQAADAQGWAVDAQAKLAGFDPAVWWPGEPASPWRRAVNRLDARVTVAGVVPLPVAGRSTLETLAAVRGRLRLEVDKSLLAGVPLSGRADLHSAANGPLRGTAAFDIAGNAVDLDASVATSGRGADDTARLDLAAPALDRLAPLFKLLQPAAADATLAGALDAHLRLAGRWPAMTTRGDLAATGLRVGTLGLGQARAQWTAGTSLDDPLDIQASLERLTVERAGAERAAVESKAVAHAAAAATPATPAPANGPANGPAPTPAAPASIPRPGAPGPSIETASLQLTGTGRAHALTLHADSRARPPAWAETAAQGGAAPPTSAPHTVATLTAGGGLTEGPNHAPSGWRGTLQQFELRSTDPRAKPLALTRDLSLEAAWSGGPARATVQPGRIELLAGALRWSRLAWQAADAPGGVPHLDVDAQIEPLRLAPLLAELQPDFGWGGDLEIAGRIALHSLPAMAADVVLERRRGDLTVTDELGTRAAGLTALRLAARADRGLWNFGIELAGQALGTTTGQVTVRSAPQALWPTPDAPVSGSLEARLGDLGALGPWLPAGWRASGALRADATIGGRFGAPEYTGRVDGSKLGVRNFLEGVNVHDGDLALTLRGTRATLERFTAQGGAGTVRIGGSASFGEAPQALLDITAERFEALGRVDRRIVASGTAKLKLDARSVALDGKFEIDEGLIDISRSDAPSLSEDVTVIRAPGVPSPAAAASAAESPKTTSAAATPVAAAAEAVKDSTAPPPREVALDLRIGLGDKLAIKGHGLDAHLGGNLRVTSPAGKPAVAGVVRVVDGSYQAYGQQLTIDRGLIVFSGPVDRPRLDIEATRPKLDIRVGVKITGTAVNPRVRLFSEPELSEVDTLSWLVLGRASDNLGRTETALLQRAAMALVSGEGPGVTDKIGKALGLDDISFGQSEGDVKQTVLSVGKKLSDRWTVGYAHGLNATAGSLQLVYKIAKRFTLRAQSGDDNSVDFIWSWRWN